MVTYGVMMTAIMGQLKGASRISGIILFLGISDGDKGYLCYKIYLTMNMFYVIFLYLF